MEYYSPVYEDPSDYFGYVPNAFKDVGERSVWRARQLFLECFQELAPAACDELATIYDNHGELISSAWQPSEINPGGYRVVPSAELCHIVKIWLERWHIDVVLPPHYSYTLVIDTLLSWDRQEMHGWEPRRTLLMGPSYGMSQESVNVRLTVESYADRRRDTKSTYRARLNAAAKEQIDAAVNDFDRAIADRPSLHKRSAEIDHMSWYVRYTSLLQGYTLIAREECKGEQTIYEGVRSAADSLGIEFKARLRGRPRKIT